MIEKVRSIAILCLVSFDLQEVAALIAAHLQGSKTAKSARQRGFGSSLRNPLPCKSLDSTVGTEDCCTSRDALTVVVQSALTYGSIGSNARLDLHGESGVPGG
jgi:hypothetical protein